MSPDTLAQLVGHHIVAAVSGGKDSTAMSLHLREAGIQQVGKARGGEGGMQLKLVPLKEHLQALADDHPVINAVGIRSAKSLARRDMPEWEWNADFDCMVWRPLITWSWQQVALAFLTLAQRCDGLVAKDLDGAQ